MCFMVLVYFVVSILLIGVDFVNVNLEILGWEVRMFLIEFGFLVIILNMFLGRFMFFVNIVRVSVENGVSLDGFRIMVYLVVSVGLILWVIIVVGKFYGVIVVIMFIGCFIICKCVFGRWFGMILL